MPAPEPLPRLLTIPELAEHLGVTQRHIRRLIAERRVPYVKWRRLIRFDPTEINAWLNQARHPEGGRGVGWPRPWPSPGRAKRGFQLGRTGGAQRHRGLRPAP